MILDRSFLPLGLICLMGISILGSLGVLKLERCTEKQLIHTQALGPKYNPYSKKPGLFGWALVMGWKAESGRVENRMA